MFAKTRARLATSIRLKLLIFITLTLISSIPVMLLAYWVQQTAIEKEVAAVEEKHLIIADSLSRAFERYASDTKAVFAHISTNFELINRMQNVDALLKSMGITELCTLSASGQLTGVLDHSGNCSFDLDDDKVSRLQAKAADNPGQVSISTLRRVNDKPVFFSGPCTQ